MRRRIAAFQGGPRVYGDHEVERPDQVGRDPIEHGTPLQVVFAYKAQVAHWQIADATVDQVLQEASFSLPADILRRDRILYTFAGLRVLQLGAETTAETPREHLVTVGPMGMVSVAGGKLTTHRRIAIDVLRRLDDSRARCHRLADVPLPGAGPLPQRPADLESDIWTHLIRHYGSEVSVLLEYAQSVPGAFERVHPGGPDVWAQVHHALKAEWAHTVEDVVRRRTTLAVRGLATAKVRGLIAKLMDLQAPAVTDG